MIEVFKTNVASPDQANMLLVQIHHAFRNCKANFDLEDCDKILRIKCTTGFLQPTDLIILLRNLGFDAEVLPD